jgi:hypothetical protein
MDTLTIIIIVLSVLAVLALGTLGVLHLINNKGDAVVASNNVAPLIGGGGDISIVQAGTNTQVQTPKPFPPASSSTYNAKVWPTVISQTPYNISFPELCSGNLYGSRKPTTDTGVSIAISGGGSRSFTVMTGFFRAINRMGFKNKAQYVSTNSGGSWFYGIYSYCQNKYTDATLLGQSCGLDSNGVPNPANIKLTELNTLNGTNNLCFVNAFINDILPYIPEGVLNGVSPGKLYSYSIGKLLLEKYGLNGNVPIALNQTHAQDIASRNVLNGTPLYLPPGMPFWICNTTLLFSYVGAAYPTAVVPMTPLYSGMAQSITQNNNSIGGITVETFAFGSASPPNNFQIPMANSLCLNQYNMNLQRTSDVCKLSDMLASSSSAYAGGFYYPQNINPLLAKILPSSATQLIPSYSIWGTSPPSLTTADSQCKYNVLTGGCDVPNGYDPNSCSKIGIQCYSNTAQQCTSNNQCTYSFSKLQCANTNPSNSDLNCRTNPSFFNPLQCKCVSSSPYTQSNIQNLYSETAALGDGGSADNHSIVSLLARGVKHIISLINNSTTQVVGGTTICDLMGLFGIAPSSCTSPFGTNLNTNQVFKVEDYNVLQAQLSNNFKNTGLTYARLSLTVLTNLNSGVAGGYTVDILFVFVQTCIGFNSKLSSDIQKQITNIPLVSTSAITSDIGQFNNFPVYSVFFQNPTLGMLALTLGQANLLTTYTDWYLTEIERVTNTSGKGGVITQMFSY